MSANCTRINYYPTKLFNMCKSHAKITIFLLVILIVILVFWPTPKDFIFNNIFNNKTTTTRKTTTKTKTTTTKTKTTTTKTKTTTRRSTTDLIPPLIHYLYLKGERGMILKSYHHLIKQCVQVNPDVKFVVWTKESMNKLLKTLATKEMQENMQEKNRRLIHRSDIFRYIVIYYFGGIYMDLDTICLQPIYSKVKENSLVLTIEASIHTKVWLHMDRVIANNFFGSTPRHPFIKYLIDNLNNIQASDNVLSSTGPVYVNSMFSKFFQNPKYKNISYRVFDSSDYFPEIDMEGLRKRCKEHPVPACDELDSYYFWLRTKGYKKAVILHETSHHGWHETKGPVFNVFKAFPTIKTWP